MNKTKSFRNKLWIYFVIFAAIIFGLLWLLQTVFLQSLYNGMLIDNTRKAANEITGQSKSEGFTEIIDKLSLDNSLLVFVTDTDGTILYSSDSYKSYYHSSNHGGGENNPYRQDETLNWQTGNYRNLPDGYRDFLSALKSSSDEETEIKTDTQYIYGTYIETEDGKEAVLYVSTTLGVVGGTASIIRVQLLWVTLLSLLIAFLIAWLLSKKFSVPVDQLSVQARMLATDSYTPIFEKGFCTELDGLSESMDEAAAMLSEAKEYQKELLANVSHDLRTPLTMIKGYAEMVRDVSWEDEASRNADTGIIIREADRLTALVNEILEYSKLQEKGISIEFAIVDLSALVMRIVSRFEPLMREQGIEIEQNIDEGCAVNGDSKLLESMAYNLIDNALRHTGSSGRVTVMLQKSSDILFEVQDHGEGIDEADIPYIWEKYYTSRQHGSKGVSGLGLAIVKRIAEIHDAQYGVDSKKGEGSRFWIKLKKQ